MRKTRKTEGLQEQTEETEFMSEANGCEICSKRAAALFMVVRQDAGGGRERVAKAHVCLNCFELAQTKRAVNVEAVSLQEFKETRETWGELRRGA